LFEAPRRFSNARLQVSSVRPLCYNASKMGFHASAYYRCVVACLFVLYGAVALRAEQAGSGARAGVAASGSQQGIYLVFPFENAGSSPRLDWLGEGLEELTIQRLAAAGRQVYSRAGRASELDRNGFPAAAKFSRASMLRIAQELDADFVIFGSFTSDGKELTVESRILRVSPTALLPQLRESGSLDSLMDLHMRLLWRLLTANDRTYPRSLNEFSKAQRPLRLDAFEHYTRGLLAADDDVRLRELRESARLEPEWPDPDFALGEAYFVRRDCASALLWLAKVPKAHQRYVEAEFATGVCRLLLNQPDRAEETFVALQKITNRNGQGNHVEGAAVSGADLPEILNDLAIARARQGKAAEAQKDLLRAAELDPDEDDYSFNLGLLALRAGDFSSAAGYFREASEREADNAEDRAFLILALEKAGKKEEADQERESAGEALGPNALPAVRLDAKGDSIARLDRIKTELDITELRFEIEVPQVHANASASEGDTPAAHIRRGRQELSAGRMDSAEKEFRAALAVEPGNATAHRSLAEIDRRGGKLDDAVKELQASLQSRDSAVVRTTLARIYLEQRKNALARAEVERALKLAPNYSEAKQLLEHLQNAKPTGGAQ
jgi:tetratricopeptide (TPR) repeat protein